MRNLLPGYYRLDDERLNQMMQSATLILDSSVLLNLYRYPKQARDDFLSILRSVKERLWIPYQVALEFQENRLSVIADQVARFDDVRKLINSTKQNLLAELDKLQLNKRHSVINPDKFMQKFGSLAEAFLDELQKWKNIIRMCFTRTNSETQSMHYWMVG